MLVGVVDVRVHEGDQKDCDVVGLFRCRRSLHIMTIQRYQMYCSLCFSSRRISYEPSTSNATIFSILSFIFERWAALEVVGAHFAICCTTFIRLKDV